MSGISEHINIKIINSISGNTILDRLIYKNEINKAQPLYDIINKIILELYESYFLENKVFYKLIYDSIIVYYINTINIGAFNDFNINDINELNFYIVYIPNMMNNLINDIILNIIDNNIDVNSLINEFLTSLKNSSSYSIDFTFEQNEIPLEYKLYTSYKLGTSYNNNINIINKGKINIIIYKDESNITIATEITEIVDIDTSIIQYNCIRSRSGSLIDFNIDQFSDDQPLDIYKYILEYLLKNFYLTIE